MSAANRALLASLLLAALVHYLWNLTTHETFHGYDVEGHMHYIATLIDEQRVPHPFDPGFSSFHPPLYYLLGAAVSWPGRPIWPALLLEGISGLSILTTGTLAFFVVRGLGHPVAVALTAAAIVLFIPCARLAGTMVGNEALAAALCAFAALAGVRLQADPRSLSRAAFAGLAVGLAMATKYSGAFALPALVVPILRQRLDRDVLRAAALGALMVVAIAGVPYARNLALTGSPVPMTREREPVASVERSLTIRDRSVVDYLWLDPAVFRLPLTHGSIDGGPTIKGLNPVMTNVWGLAYASAWYDAHGLRIAPAEATRAGRVLLALGIVPSALLLLGFALTLRDLRILGIGQPVAPLVGMAVFGALGFVYFTAWAPSVAAVKASYLLPLAVPAAVFFARGVAAFGVLARRAALGASACAALACAVVFTNGIVSPTFSPAPTDPPTWLSTGSAKVAVALDGASAGRWLRIHVEPAVNDGVVWRFLARSWPPLRNAEVATWCREIGGSMASLDPGRAWRAVFVQGRGKRRCDGSGAARP